MSMARDHDMQQERLPFNLLDGAFLNIERAAEPWSIHLELWV